MPRFHARPIGISLLAIVLFGAALQWFGLVAAIGVLVIVGAYAARDVRPLENLVLAAVMILFSVAVFVWLLGLPLPLWPNS
jgi:Mn2+/Fe2+ NRAMP family transporter